MEEIVHALFHDLVAQKTSWYVIDSSTRYNVKFSKIPKKLLEMNKNEIELKENDQETTITENLAITIEGSKRNNADEAA